MDGGTSAATIQETTRAQIEHRDTLSKSSFFRDPAKYEPYLEGLMKSLSKRELLLGHYTHVTALTYASLGNAYRNLQEPRAVAMYRTQYRIMRVLYGKTNGHISGALRELLQLRGLSSSQIVAIKKDVYYSTRHELQGDCFRRFGQPMKAIVEYHKAARIEEISFGRDNADLAYLWRKIAYLVAIEQRYWAKEGKSESIGSTKLDFDEADRVGSNYFVEAKIKLSNEARRCIDSGDEFFSLQLYSNAVSQYTMASSRTLAALALRQTEFLDQLTVEERPPSHRNRKPEESKRHRDATSSRQQKKDTTELDQHTLPTSVSSLITTLTDTSRLTLDKPKSEVSPHIPKHRSTRASRSTASLSSSHGRPSQSQPLGEKSKTHPASDSYLLKLARQTRKVASSSSKVAKRTLSKRIHSHHKDDDDLRSQGTATVSSRSKSSKKESSYETVPLPPLTPHQLVKHSHSGQNSPQPSIESKDTTAGLLQRFIPFRRQGKHNGSPLEDVASDETATTENRSITAMKASYTNQ